MIIKYKQTCIDDNVRTHTLSTDDMTSTSNTGSVKLKLPLKRKWANKENVSRYWNVTVGMLKE